MAQGSIAAAVPIDGRSRSIRIVVAGALAAIVVLLASGCVNGAPNTVAYVGDGQITQTQVDRALAGVQGTLEAGQQVSAPAVVNAMIHGTMARQIAATNRVTVTDAQRDQLLASSDLGALLTQPDAKAVAYDLADTQLVAQAVGSEAYLKAVQATHVELNPRFGVLDPTNKTILDGQSSSLSLPAGTS